MRKLLTKTQVNIARELIQEKLDLQERLKLLSYEKIGEKLGVNGSVIRDIRHEITYTNIK